MPKGIPKTKTGPKTLEEKFWEKVEKTDDCWNWTGAKFLSNYGMLVHGKQLRVHRVSWQIHNRQLQEGEIVRHLCHNRLCVNPDHLAIGSHQDNMDDMVSANRQATGIRHGRAKLTEPKVRAIKALVKAGWKQNYLAKSYGVHHVTINDIATGRRWKHV